MNADALLWQGKSIGSIGGGNMAEALLRGVVSAGLTAPERICVFDIIPERRDVFKKMGCLPAGSPADALAADVVLLAVKPQNMREALRTVAPRAGQVFVSIAAGIRLAMLESWLAPGAKVVRVMPNTPLLAGKGMSALCPGARATPEDTRMVEALFRCGGDAVQVTEADMDAVTALSGSGPAYVFRFAEALFAAGEGLGLSPELSKRLAIGTVRGAAEMLERDGDAAELRRRVTSPGGTTAAALDAFEKGGLEELVKSALEAARTRSVELGRGE